MLKILIYLLILTGGLISSGCFPSLAKKQAGISSISNKFVDEYYIDKSVTQYFIKPILFKDSKNNTLLVDFTFRVNTITKNERVKIAGNLTIFLSEKDIDSLNIRYNQNKYGESIVPETIELFYREVSSNNRYLNRFGSKFESADPFQTIRNMENGITVLVKSKVYKFLPTKKTISKLRSLSSINTF